MIAKIFGKIVRTIDLFYRKKKMNWILYLLQEMLNLRATLPIAALKGDILQLMKEHDVLVVCGETGSGKTTQVTDFDYNL